MKKEYHFYVYIVSNFSRTTLYIGFTNDIIRRTIEHKYGCGSEFTKKYKLNFLIYYEEYQFVDEAIAREKQLKGWKRDKKVKLIKSVNPKIIDLSDELFKECEIGREEIGEYLEAIRERNGLQY